MVTGTGVVCSAGLTVEEAMKSLYSGRRNPAPPGRIKTSLQESFPVFETEDFPLDRNLTRTNNLLVKALDEAMQQACIDTQTWRNRSVGVAIGTTVGCTLNNEPFYRDFKAGKKPGITPVARFLESNPAAFISKKFSLTGPVATVANACSSGTDAIGLAKSWIEQGLCDTAIAGGSDELSRITYLGFISLMNTSRKPCMPFDMDRSGLNLGEGAGVLILEKEDFAGRRNAPGLGFIAGYASAADAYHPTAPHPEGRGLKRAIRASLQDAGITSADIGFINAHGTSTVDNDRVEGRVIAELFSGSVPVVSTKAYTGHTLGAAGGVEAVFTIQALLDQKLPATPGFKTVDPECRITPTTQNIQVNTSYAMSNSLAFGGNNAVLIAGRC
jgi:3-oxoacyl-[acyl-carrier-protein] synthase-1/3-oxoacyl-[acyl-carrier-protein] synthase II